MEHVKNKSLKYHQAKNGILVDGIFSDDEIYDTICGLILFYLRKIKEENFLPKLNIKKLQEQKNYLHILNNIKKTHFKKINFKDKKIFLVIFMSLELIEKNKTGRVKI
jgi:hypothetical protein